MLMVEDRSNKEKSEWSGKQEERIQLFGTSTVKLYTYVETKVKQ